MHAPLCKYALLRHKVHSPPMQVWQLTSHVGWDGCTGSVVVAAWEVAVSASPLPSSPPPPALLLPPEPGSHAPFANEQRLDGQVNSSQK